MTKYLYYIIFILLVSCNPKNKIYEITVESQGSHKVYFSKIKPYPETSIGFLTNPPTGSTIIDTIDGEEIKIVSGTITTRLIERNK